MIRVALDAMGGDSAPRAEIAGVVEALAELPDEFLIQLVGRPERDRGRAGAPSRASTGPASRSTRRPTSSAWARSRSRRSARSRSPASSSASACRRDGRSDAFISAGNTGAMLAGVHHAARPARRRRARHRRHAVSHRQPSRSWSSTAAPTSTAPPGSWSASPTSAPSTCATSWAGPTPSSASSTSARRRRRAPRSCARPTSCSSRRPGINYVGNIEGRDILPGPQQRGPGRRRGVRRLRRQRRAQVLRVGGPGLRRPAASERIPDVFERPAMRELIPHPRLLRVRRRAAARRARASPSSATAPPAPTRSRTPSGWRCRRSRRA